MLQIILLASNQNSNNYRSISHVKNFSTTEGKSGVYKLKCGDYFYPLNRLLTNYKNLRDIHWDSIILQNAMDSVQVENVKLSMSMVQSTTQFISTKLLKHLQHVLMSIHHCGKITIGKNSDKDLLESMQNFISTLFSNIIRFTTLRTRSSG